MAEIFSVGRGEAFPPEDSRVDGDTGVKGGLECIAHREAAGYEAELQRPLGLRELREPVVRGRWTVFKPGDPAGF